MLRTMACSGMEIDERAVTFVPFGDEESPDGLQPALDPSSGISAPM